MAGKIIRCARCGRRHRGQTDWNAVYQHGVVTHYLCPDDQTPQDNAEAVINEATGVRVGREVRPGDPGYGESVIAHIVEVADEVIVEWLGSIVASGEPAALDLDELTDRTMARLRATLGEPTDPSVRQTVRNIVRDLCQGRADGRHEE